MKTDHRVFTQALLKILTVKIRGPKGVIEIPTLIDEGSNMTILDAGVAKILGIYGSNQRRLVTSLFTCSTDLKMVISEKNRLSSKQ